MIAVCGLQRSYRIVLNVERGVRRRMYVFGAAPRGPARCARRVGAFGLWTGRVVCLPAHRRCGALCRYPVPPVSVPDRVGHAGVGHLFLVVFFLLLPRSSPRVAQWARVTHHCRLQHVSPLLHSPRVPSRLGHCAADGRPCQDGYVEGCHIPAVVSSRRCQAGHISTYMTILPPPPLPRGCD